MDSKIEEFNFAELRNQLFDQEQNQECDTLDQIKTLFLTSQIRYNTLLNMSLSKIEGDEMEVYSENEDDYQAIEMQQGNIDQDLMTKSNQSNVDHDDQENIQELQIQDIHDQYEENNTNNHVDPNKHVVLQRQKKVYDNENGEEVIEKLKENVKFQRQNEINVSELYNNDQQALIYEKNNCINLFHNKNKNYAQDQKALQKIRDIHRQYMGIKEGYLYKKSNGIMGMYEKKFFILTNSRFFFFKDDKKMVVNGVINFKVAKCSVVNNRDKLFSIAIEDYKNHYHLRASTNQEASSWIDLIQCVISENKQKKAWIMTTNLKMYLEADSLTEEELIDFAETGDILLFSTNNIASKLQRGITGSKFGILEKNILKLNKITGTFVYLIHHRIQEQLSCSGMSTLNPMISSSRFKRVVVRKLVYNRRLEIEPLLIQFVGETLGKKYLLSAQKLMKRKSFGRRPNEEGYFCSELIAKALKQSKLLDPIKSSCQYWPVDFSQEKQLQLQNGAKLSNEITIILQKHRYL